MKKHTLNLSMVTLIFLVGGGCATYERTEGMPPLRIATKTPERIILRTDGSPGQSFSAVLTVDGSHREISGVTPTEFPMECVVLVGEVTRVDGDGGFSFMIERQDGTGRCYTPAVKDLVRFRYHSRILEVVTKNRYGFGGSQADAHEPPLRAAASTASVDRTLDSLPEPVSGGGRCSESFGACENLR